MKILLLPADRSGCAFYRMSEPAKAVQEAYPDIEIEISYHLDVEGEYVTGSEEPTKISSVDPHGADVVVFQRPSNKAFPQAIRKLKEMGVAVVVEIDDLLHGVSVGHSGYKELVTNGGGNRILDCARQADLVTVSTPALARIYGTRCPSRVIRNAVPRRIAELTPAYERNSEVVTIGWTGSVFTHPHDLQMMGSGMRTALQNTPAKSRFVVFGQAHGAQQRLSLPDTVPEIMWISDPEAYLRALGSFFEIGVAPLRMDTFNEAKCLDASTLITSRRGTLPIGCLEKDDQVWHDGKWRQVLATESYSRKQGIEIVTKSGYSLKLTKEHRLLTSTGWKSASEMKIGNVLEMEPETHGHGAYQILPWPTDSRMSRDESVDQRGFWQQTDGPQVVVNERWGRLLGMILGDGCLTAHTAVSIAFDGLDQDLIDLIMNDWRAIGLNPRTEENAFNDDGSILRSRSVSVSSAHMSRFLELVGMATPKPGRQTRGWDKVFAIPDVIWRSPKSVMAAFLSGLMEADGSGAAGYTLCTKSERLARDVQRALLLFGIKSSLKVTSNSQWSETRWYWLLSMGKRATDIFVKEIGLLSQRKHGKLVDARNRLSPGFRGGHGQIVHWSDEIIFIRRCEVDPVDIQVEGEVFSAAGFVSHNSALKPMEYAARGIYPIRSVTPEYEQLGVGRFAKSPKDWGRELTRAVVDQDMRKEFAARERERVLAEHLTDNRVEQWAEAWKTAADLATKTRV